MATVIEIPSVGTALVRAIEASAKRWGVGITVPVNDWKRWASASFTGAQHKLTIEGPDNGSLHGWLSTLADGLPMRGHLVADANVLAVSCADGAATVTLEILTVEE